MDALKILSELKKEEKAALVAGTDFMYTNPVPRLNIQSIRMSDGPHGLRVQNGGGDNGVTGSLPATAFPPAVTVASSWDPENAYKIGKAIGEESNYYGIDVVLGPGTNIKRNPLAGRNFEYYSEDPLLSGTFAASEIKGIESQGVASCLKHFALNNSENFRFMGNSVVDERTIREIYLKPFEIALKEGRAESVMCAYNQINGVYCCHNKWLLNDVLRGEWGFEGTVITDWGATHDRIKMLQAGVDLEMPGDTPICRKWIIDGLNNGTLSQTDLDKAVSNVLNLVSKHQNKHKTDADFESHHLLAEEIAADSAVLLKNNGVLPLKESERIAVIGELFDKPRYQGSGSSMINPKFLSSPKTAFEKHGVRFVYQKGYKANENDVDLKLIHEAVEAAREYETVFLSLGLTDYSESEGGDRESMSLPKNQLALIDALLPLNKKIAVILYGGSPCELPFEDKVNAILNMYLPGQGGGEALWKLVYGEKAPSGRLAESWPLSYEDVPFGESFGKGINEIYKEGILVGYRYYLTANKRVRYPFGYGLSYTKFEYSSFSVKEERDEVIVGFSIKNVGDFDGAEVAEIYVSSPSSDCFKAKRELKGFQKVHLRKGEEKNVSLSIKKDDLRYWNAKEHRWVLESGDYLFNLCSDSETVILSKTVSIVGEKASVPYLQVINRIYGAGEVSHMTNDVFEQMSGLKIPQEPKRKPIRMESRFTDFQQTMIGKILFNAVLSVAKNDMKKAKKLPEGQERDNKIKGAYFLKRILESNSIITMSMSAGKSFPYNFAQGMVDLANGHILRGIKDFCVSVKAPKLPKDEKKEN